MAIIFTYKGKKYGYHVLDGKVENYEVYDGLYPELCENKEEEEALEDFFTYLATTATVEAR